ncbi:TlpA disulfide reductase family protein [Streptomyces xinghaiensis]|uniref:TlpA disulfide reductase family protein n=1 Tax=Streptomyces xinghaiensis TaxID=1038928 RepID=UPI001EE0DCC2|nr:TlpA disulfide reductase family protein [Streptomyces xinghaiensis]
MMPILTAAAVLAGLLCVLDLMLTLGVIRRLREHTALLTDLNGGPASIKAGEEVGEFTTLTVEGKPLNRAAMAEETLVAFFSPDCGPCQEKMPKFVEYASTLPGGRDRVLAVVVAEPHEGTEFLSALAPVAQVVRESPDGPVGTAFKVRAYPLVLAVARDRRDRVIVTDDRVALEQAVAAA